MRTIVIIGLLSLQVAWSFAAERVPSFSKLGRDDVVDVRYSTTGCFHSAAYEFSFAGGATTTVAVVRVGRDILARSQTNRTALTTLSLTPTDTDGLDRLVDFYRSDHSGRGCTTVDTITIIHRRSGRVAATEHFTDPTCGAHEVKRVRTLSELVGRAGGYK